MGGLPRKAAQLNLARQQDPALLALDAGGLLFKRQRLNPGLKLQDQAVARGLVAAYHAMEFDAVGINALDLAAGLDFLLEITADRQPPVWLSADLIHQELDEAPFPSGIILDKGDSKIGVIALTGSLPPAMMEDEVGPSAPTGTSGLALLPWRQVLPELVARFSPESDLLVLLSGLEAADNEAIAAEFPEVHLIIVAGRNTEANLHPRRHNNTVITAVGRQGKRVGLMEITWTRDRIWFDQELAQLEEKRQELDRLNWQWRSLQRSLQWVEEERSPGGSEPPAAETESQKIYRQRMAAYQDELQQEIEALQKAVAELEQVAGRRQAGSFNNLFFNLDHNFPEDAEMLQMVATINQEINEIGRGQAAVRRQNQEERETSPYLGWTACAQCHQPQTANWQQSRHAQAYETLEQRQRQYDPACISCHVTGTYEDDESLALSLPAPLRGVGCEVCHGPGRQHVAGRDQAGAATALTRRPPAETCRRCHTVDQSPDFNYLEAMNYLEELCRPTP
ncbi:UshA-like (seleno)protein [Desulfurivibrio alkaliphilus]|nr:UshA-like (seleno)protein [Desulfurivibrio alkaliphilus]MDF1614950.1 UshA-like (seleno)protein [Desulfurivibrio alkaliphilus]